jgi:hypothetical protein
VGQKLWQQKVFSQAKGVYIVHDKSRGVVQQIIFLAWYPEAAIHSQGSLTDGNAFTSIQYQDAIWNTAVAVSGHDLQIIKSYFAWRAQQKIIFDLSRQPRSPARFRCWYPGDTRQLLSLAKMSVQLWRSGSRETILLLKTNLLCYLWNRSRPRRDDTDRARLGWLERRNRNAA